MEQRDLAGQRVSLLGFGGMRLPFTGSNAKDIDQEALAALVSRAIALGVNYFDTAYGYHEGRSEGALAKALSPYPRASYVLADKLPVWLLEGEGDADRLFAEQLARSETTYFDVYLLHSISRKTMDKIDEFSLIEWAMEKKKQGQIRAFGFSFHDEPDAMRDLLSMHDWDVIQIQLNALDWDMQRAGETYGLIRERNIPIVVMEPVRGGALHTLTEEARQMLRKARPEASEASWAIRFAASLPGVVTVLSGMGKATELEDNAKTLSPLASLSEEERAVYQQAIDQYRAIGIVPCTACRYCTLCPQGIGIAEMIATLNEYLVTQNRTTFFHFYNRMDEKKRASACIACKLCENVCPQRIEIAALMGQIKDIAEDRSAP